MGTPRLFVVLTLLAAGLPTFGADSGPGPKYTEPLGIGLEGWHYPHPVQFFTLEAEGQTLRMAYMDVAPSGGSASADCPAVALSVC